jgi:hypothetical protein
VRQWIETNEYVLGRLRNSIQGLTVPMNEVSQNWIQHLFSLKKNDFLLLLWISQHFRGMKKCADLRRCKANQRMVEDFLMNDMISM